MIVHIGEINLQNSYAVSEIVDHLIDILKTASLPKELTVKMEILNKIQIALHNVGMAIRILKPQQIQCFEYNIIG